LPVTEVWKSRHFLILNDLQRRQPLPLLIAAICHTVIVGAVHARDDNLNQPGRSAEPPDGAI
jgi:hypothetical protein